MRDAKSQELIENIKTEIHRLVIGQEKVVLALIRGILADGNVLLEGVPGLAKTVIIRTLAEILNCDFKRVQFTIDLLPSDITGVNSFDPKTSDYKIVKGPIFTNLLLADEINRASPKVQSALLEAMAEKQVTLGNETQKLPDPFFVFATQNPLESLGTYPLPQAQLDRFIFKLIIGYPKQSEEVQIIDSNLAAHSHKKNNGVKSLIEKSDIKKMQADVRAIFIHDSLKMYAVQIINATRYPKKFGLKNADYIEVGCGPRATISLVQAAKAEAYLNGRDFVTPHDFHQVAHDVLRHRLEVNYLGQAKGISSDKVVTEILATVHVP
ncbi:MAG: AAA family ATPase [Candidatus Woesearchaeota archaeon]